MKTLRKDLKFTQNYILDSDTNLISNPILDILYKKLHPYDANISYANKLDMFYSVFNKFVKHAPLTTIDKIDEINCNVDGLYISDKCQRYFISKELCDKIKSQEIVESDTEDDTISKYYKLCSWIDPFLEISLFIDVYEEDDNEKVYYYPEEPEPTADEIVLDEAGDHAWMLHNERDPWNSDDPYLKAYRLLSSPEIEGSSVRKFKKELKKMINESEGVEEKRCYQEMIEFIDNKDKNKAYPTPKEEEELNNLEDYVEAIDNEMFANNAYISSKELACASLLKLIENASNMQSVIDYINNKIKKSNEKEFHQLILDFILKVVKNDQ